MPRTTMRCFQFVKVVKCGLFINQQNPWMHATPDFLCTCDCCGEGEGEINCPLCMENCDFDSYLLRPSSCLKKEQCWEVYTAQDT